MAGAGPLLPVPFSTCPPIKGSKLSFLVRQPLFSEEASEKGKRGRERERDRVCVCVCVREIKRERETERGGGWGDGGK